MNQSKNSQKPAKFKYEYVEELRNAIDKLCKELGLPSREKLYRRAEENSNFDADRWRKLLNGAVKINTTDIPNLVDGLQKYNEEKEVERHKRPAEFFDEWEGILNDAAGIRIPNRKVAFNNKVQVNKNNENEDDELSRLAELDYLESASIGVLAQKIRSAPSISGSPLKITRTEEEYIRIGQEYVDEGLKNGSSRYFDKAVKEYSEAIKLNRNNFHHYYLRSEAYYNKGDYQKAISDCEEAIRLRPEWLEYHKWLKRIENDRDFYSGKFNNTYYTSLIRDFTSAISAEQNNSDNYFMRGVSYYYTNEQNKAIEDFKLAIKLKPKYARAYYFLGLAFDQKGDAGAAYDSFQEAFDFGYDEAEIKINKASERKNL